MEKSIITSGKTIDLAIESALSQLGLDRDSVSVTVLQQAKSGFLGFGAQSAKVQVTYEVPDPVPEKEEKPKSALGSASRSKPKAPAAPVKKPEAPQPPKAEPPKPAPGRPLPKWLIPGIAAAVAVIALIISIGSGGEKSTPASSVKAPAAQAVTTEPVPTVPMEVHTMAAADYVYTSDPSATPFWGQERYMRKDVKTVTFQSSLQNAPANSWDVSEAGDGSVLAWMDNGDLYVAADGAIAPNSDASWLFQNFVNLKTIDFGNCFVTSNVTRTNGMFNGCSSLTSLDLSGFDTSNVTYMGWMFGSCASLTSLDLTSFDTSKVTDMAFMFTSCNSLTRLDLSNFDTSNVTNMLWMFGLCYDLTSLNLSSFDASAVTEMDDIFTGCYVLTDLNCSDARILKEYNRR